MMLSDLPSGKATQEERKRNVEVKLIHANGKSFYASSGTEIAEINFVLMLDKTGLTQKSSD